MEFSRTLDKAVVHRCAVAEVFLTSSAAEPDGTYRLGVQLPRRHGYYGDQTCPGAGHDPLLLLETFRQAAYVLFHEFRAVPLDKAFLLRDASVEVLDAGALRSGAAPLEAVVYSRVRREFADDDGPATGMHTEHDLVVDGTVAARGAINASWVEPGVMGALRARTRAGLGLPALPPPPAAVTGVDPARVDRRLPQNVVISPVSDDGGGRASATLAVDPGHPSFFDHPLDHVPGMLTVEACRQTVLAGPGAPRTNRRLDAITLRFREFAELDLPARCRAEPAGDDEWQVVVSQDARVVAEARVRMGAPVREPLAVR